MEHVKAYGYLELRAAGYMLPAKNLIFNLDSCSVICTHIHVRLYFYLAKI